MSKKKKKRKEILVSPPYPRRLEPPLLEDTTEMERRQVFEKLMKVSKYFGGLLIATGILLFLLSTQFLSILEARILFLLVLGFISIVNILCGLMLLAKE
ncbi:hypothetical protein DRO69_01975 [Candidatus Bathyarchaeota archaeon]|nr:MAG: hypothetical protein DRO69_01975 [Candidatus Bathyarchaeota archaeon]